MLVCESVGKADLPAGDFDSKQSRESVDSPFTCQLFPSLTTFAVRSCEVRSLVLNFDLFGGTDQLGRSHVHMKKSDVSATSSPR